MHNSYPKQYYFINKFDKEIIQKQSKKIANLDNYNIEPKVIAVSKTFKMDHILPLIDHGHKHFGENKVQEAVEKWSDIKKKIKI